MTSWPVQLSPCGSDDLGDLERLVEYSRPSTYEEQEAMRVQRETDTRLSKPKISGGLHKVFREKRHSTGRPQRQVKLDLSQFHNNREPDSAVGDLMELIYRN